MLTPASAKIPMMPLDRRICQALFSKTQPCARIHLSAQASILLCRSKSQVKVLGACLINFHIHKIAQAEILKQS